MARIVYAGSPDVSVLPLKELFQSQEHTVAAVLTNPPTARGRSGALVPTAVEQAAHDFNRDFGTERGETVILTPEKLDASVRSQIETLHPDILVCFAYGKIFGPKFMALFPMGGINIHPSLLPEYRGCAPVPAALLDRRSQTGVTVQRISQQMDCGDILAQQVIPLDGTETADSLLEHAAGIGSVLVLDVLEKLEKGEARVVCQDDNGASYCRMIKKEDGLIDWTQSASVIDAKIRAFKPWPGTFTSLNGVKLYIHEARVYEGTAPEYSAVQGAADQSARAGAADHAPHISTLPPGAILGCDKKNGILFQTGDGILCVTNLQLQAKKALNWKDFMNGNRNIAGCICEIYRGII